MSIIPYIRFGWSIFLLLLCMTSHDLYGQAFVVNGSATQLAGNCYQLTPDQGGLAGTMFSVNSINLTQPFSTTAVLNFGCKNANGADGIVFILATSNTSLGGAGGSIGYEGITPSIAIEYDDYQNGWGDPAADHMAIVSNGSVDHNAPTNLVGPFVIDEIEDCEDHCFAFDWNPVTQTFTGILDTHIITYTGDIINSIFGGNPVVYYGYSAGTGSLSNLHTVCVGPPELVPMEDVTICEGETVQLEADENGFAWTWEFDPTLSELDISDPFATPVQTTTYIVSIEYACGGFTDDTVTVELIPAPDAIATNNGPLCAGQTLILMADGGIGYAWSGPQGFLSTLQNPQIPDMSPAQSGQYVVTITDAFGCTAEAMTEVIVNVPEDVEILPVPIPVCEGADPIQLTGIPGQGVWSGEIDVTGLFDPVSIGVGLHDVFYTITDANGCTNSAQLTIEVVPNTPALIIPDGPFCVTDPVQILSATPAGGTWGEAADENGRVYPALLGVGTFEVTYMLSDQNGCYDAEIFIEVLATPEVLIDVPDPFCPNLPVQTLSANPPGGVWGGIAGSGGQIDPGMLGAGMYDVSYTFQESNGCSDADTIQISILPFPPQVSGFALICDSLATGYVVTFEITGGEASSYAVTGTPGGMLIPGTPYIYISDTIPTGGGYNISVDDANGCDPIILAGSYSCFCGTNAGSMQQQLIEACAGDTITIMPTEGAMLDPNDAIVYILHQGNSNSIDSVILTSSTGVFPFDTSLQTGVVYYVSAVAGNALLPLGIDLLDPCLSVTIGTPVLWHPLPTGSITAPTMLCASDSAQIVISFFGVGPFDMVYTDGSALISIDDVPNPYTVMVAPSQTTTYTLVLVSDQSGPGCVSVLNAGVTIEVVDAVTEQVSVEVCDGDSIFAGGAMQGAGGVYYDTLASVDGCDSIVMTLLTVHDLNATYLNYTSCDSAQAGTFINIFPDIHGCDSTVVTTIAFAESDTSFISAATCDSAMAGTFFYPYTTQDGCDSLVIETVVLLPRDTTVQVLLTCDAAAAGTFIATFVNQYGCDSITIDSVFLAPTDTTQLLAVTCDSSASGTFTDYYQNVYGCDSLVVETISLAPSWLITQSSVTCDSTLSGVFTYTYQTQLGCDSVVIETIDALPGDIHTEFTMICDPLDTGTLVLSLENRYGCDSTVFLIAQLAPEDSCKQASREIFVPNVFSPNGDGINDVVYIQADPATVAHVHVFRIFDRWGEFIIEFHDFPPNNPAYGWDGTLAHKAMQPGVFVWVMEIEYTDGVMAVVHGDVTLVR